jgi:hypothetical protein
MIHFDRESLGGSMLGHFRDQGGLFSYISPETRVPAGHPLRQIRALVRAVLKDLGPSFGKLYASEGRPSIPPEQLLSALLLQAFYGVRSERQLMEQLDYNLLYRWFVGLAPDDQHWTAISFVSSTKHILGRCTRESGLRDATAASALESLHSTFGAWKAATPTPAAAPFEAVE